MSQSILIPLIAVGAVLALLVLVVAILSLRDPQGATRRVESLFRRPPKQPKQPDTNHYYKPYWS
jgi:hypothetical protein